MQAIDVLVGLRAESRIQASDEIMPTKIAAVMPCLVVPRQKSSMTSDGRLADAATLNAQPTRKLTLSFWNRMPSTIAMTPTTTAVILPARTFGVIVHLDLAGSSPSGRAPPRRWPP